MGLVLAFFGLRIFDKLIFLLDGCLDGLAEDFSDGFAEGFTDIFTDDFDFAMVQSPLFLVTETYKIAKMVIRKVIRLNQPRQA